MTEFRRSRRAGQLALSEIVRISEAARALRAEGRDVLTFGTGEPDFPTPRHVIDAAGDPITGFVRIRGHDGEVHKGEPVMLVIERQKRHRRIFMLNTRVEHALVPVKHFVEAPCAEHDVGNFYGYGQAVHRLLRHA